MEMKELVILSVGPSVFVYFLLMIFLVVSDCRSCCTRSGPILFSCLPKLFLLGFTEKKRENGGGLRYYIYGKLVHHSILLWWHLTFLFIVTWTFNVFWKTFLLEESTTCNPEWNCFIDGSFVRTNSCVVLEQDPTTFYQQPTTTMYCYHLSLNVTKGLLYSGGLLVLMLTVCTCNLLNLAIFRIFYIQRTIVKRILTFVVFFCMFSFIIGYIVLLHLNILDILNRKNRIVSILMFWTHMFFSLMMIQAFCYQFLFALAVKSKMYVSEEKHSDWNKDFEEIVMI